MGTKDEEEEEDPLDLPSVGAEGTEPDCSEGTTGSLAGFFTFGVESRCKAGGLCWMGEGWSTNFRIPVSWSVVIAGGCEGAGGGATFEAFPV